MWNDSVKEMADNRVREEEMDLQVILLLQGHQVNQILHSFPKREKEV